jgi:hypothetical protein
MGDSDMQTFCASRTSTVIVCLENGHALRSLRDTARHLLAWLLSWHACMTVASEASFLSSLHNSRLTRHIFDRAYFGHRPFGVGACCSVGSCHDHVSYSNTTALRPSQSSSPQISTQDTFRMFQKHSYIYYQPSSSPPNSRILLPVVFLHRTWACPRSLTPHTKSQPTTLSLPPLAFCRRPGLVCLKAICSNNGASANKLWYELPTSRLKPERHNEDK